MAFNDLNLKCLECNEEFVFSANEQEFFAQKNFTSNPKRCPACRKIAKKRNQSKSSPYDGEYRSPAFNDSNFRKPRHFKPRQQDNIQHKKKALEAPNFDSEYRSPAFRDIDHLNFEDEYRSPAFSEYKNIKPDEEYRSPAFREYTNIKPEEEYRSPAFNYHTKKTKMERPLFKIICVACGHEAMVPFVPEEKEEPMCKDCYREHKELLKKEQEEQAKEEQVQNNQVQDKNVETLDNQ